jgi:hypothetical protein
MIPSDHDGVRREGAYSTTEAENEPRIARIDHIFCMGDLPASPLDEDLLGGSSDRSAE